MLRLMYITNRPAVARIAENAGVDRIFVDMEYIGKDRRQAGLDTVKSHHTIADIQSVRAVVKKAELLVRINPIHEKTEEYSSSEEEIKYAIDSGADIIMLPMFRTMYEVNRFIDCVNGRCKTMLLVETPEAVDIINEISMCSVNEIHIGLNDLHLALKKKFMFELLADGTVDSICDVLKNSDKKYGFGGIARLGYGDVPADYIIPEHYRLGSQIAILSRSFCNANIVQNPEDIKDIFEEGIKGIREFEKRVAQFTEEEFILNRQMFISLVNQFVKKLGG